MIIHMLNYRRNRSNSKSMLLWSSPFLSLPLRAPYPANDSPTLNARTRSVAQTASIGLSAARPQARFGSSAGSQGVLDVRSQKRQTPPDNQKFKAIASAIKYMNSPSFRRIPWRAQAPESRAELRTYDNFTFYIFSFAFPALEGRVKSPSNRYRRRWR
jgi:hypothetical protein